MFKMMIGGLGYCRESYDPLPNPHSSLFQDKGEWGFSRGLV